ncbi:MAG: hypothetical protein D6722_27050 [Bacteroidetes bacterium]|nr:MAG: hypothetical protein D6722_27050 [Bacteroidota bacterium]
MRPLYLLALGSLLALGACRLYDPQEGIVTADILSLTLEHEAILADGRDAMLLTVSLGPEAQANQLVTFQTSQGRFAAAAGLGGGSEAQSISLMSSGRMASAYLIADQVVNDRVTVSAQVGDFVVVEAARFERAYPEQILATLSEPILPATPGAETTLSLQLLRSLGQVSDGTQVDFAYTDLSDTTELRLSLPETAFSEGNSLEVPVTVRSGSGVAEVVAEVRDESGNLVVSKSVVVEVVE